MSTLSHPMKDMREGLSVALALRIKDALLLIKSGRVDDARFCLEDVIDYASSLDDDIAGPPALDPDHQRNYSHGGF